MKLRITFVLLGCLGLLFAGCTGASSVTDTPPASTPAVTETPLPTLMATPTLSFIPFITATMDPDAQATARAEAENVLDVIRTSFGAPIRIELPAQWQSGNAALPVSDGADVGLIAVVATEQVPELTASAPVNGTEEASAGSIGFLPFTVYRGPVTGGTGYITVIWGFRNVTTAAPFQEGGAQVYLRGDAIRLLNLTLLDPGCNVGIDDDREFIVAGEPAIGAYFAAVECPPLMDGSPGLPDIRGWFAITQRENVNFAFYMYTEPADALNGPAQQELQALVENLEIDFSLLPDPATPTPAATP